MTKNILDRIRKVRDNKRGMLPSNLPEKERKERLSTVRMLAKGFEELEELERNGINFKIEYIVLTVDVPKGL